jgi:UDP-N-acetylglucosamine--N-acetylmuramyl-(pentapeptide) pyrophosphoryl-undecaprenol N-acetylglucosamine transferase
VRSRLDELGPPASIHAVAYLEDMPSALAAADFAVSRAGAMTIAEFLNHGLPAVLVPLPTSAENHQMYNARALADAGAAVLVPQPELDARRLAAELGMLAGDAEALARMGVAARARSRPDARFEIAADIEGLLAGKRVGAPAARGASPGRGGAA